MENHPKLKLPNYKVRLNFYREMLSMYFPNIVSDWIDIVHLQLKGQPYETEDWDDLKVSLKLLLNISLIRNQKAEKTNQILLDEFEFGKTSFVARLCKIKDIQDELISNKIISIWDNSGYKMLVNLITKSNINELAIELKKYIDAI